MPSIEELKAAIGDKVIDKDGKEIAVEDLCGEGKYIGLYFSAHWCGPCRGFTPKLMAFYEKVHATKNLEIIFVSGDRDDKSFREYYGTMPWLAMPFDDKYKARDEVSAAFNIFSIPSFIVLNASDGTTLTSYGRQEVEADPDGEKFPAWTGGGGSWCSIM